MLGPMLRAEVGDKVYVHFLNRLSVAASVHAHGLRYGKNSEGAPYDDGTGGACPGVPVQATRVLLSHYRLQSVSSSTKVDICPAESKAYP